LFTWLRAGGAQGLDGVDVRLSEVDGCGFGLFAARAFQPGEMVVSVPERLCLLGKPLAKETGHSHLASGVTAAAAAFLRECRDMGRSRFAPYIASLPQACDLRSHPFLWPRGSSFRRGALAGLLAAAPRTRRRLRLAKLRAADGARTLLATGAARTDEEARWALAVVRSRAFPVGTGGNPALCPLLDLLNHHTPMPDSAPAAACHYVRLDSGAVGMVAVREVSPCEELRHIYALCPSADLLAGYGFAPAGGNAGLEACLLEVPAAALQSGGSEASAARAEALGRRGLWRGRRRGRPLLLPLAGSPGLDGGLLLPVARLAVLPSAAIVRELEAEVLDARRHLASESHEAAARAMASCWLVAQRTRAEAAVGCPISGPSASVPWEPALRRVLLAEVEVLWRHERGLCGKGAR